MKMCAKYKAEREKKRRKLELPQMNNFNMNNFYLLSNHIYLGFKMVFEVIFKWMHIMVQEHSFLNGVSYDWHLE